MSTQPGEETPLRAEQLGFAEVLFQALASAAPALGVTLAVVVGATFAGGTLSLALVLALVGILLVATCIGQMTQRFPSAGGFYTFPAHGLRPALGTLVAWLYLAIWIVFPSTLFLPFGAFVATTLEDWFGWAQTPVWIVSALVCIAAIAALVFAGARLSTRAGIVLGLVELAIVGVLAAWLIVAAGGANTLLIAGLGYAAYEWTRHPERARATERIFLDDVAGEVADPLSVQVGAGIRSLAP
jgi:amino acid transporter